MMIISKGAKVKCKKCKKLYEITPDDFGDADIFSDERNMGAEHQYTWTYEISCERCGNELVVIIEGYEYPEGAFNSEEFITEGCLLVEDPNLEMEYKEYNDEDEIC